jgi:FkbM family methyltransferase
LHFNRSPAESELIFISKMVHLSYPMFDQSSDQVNKPIAHPVFAQFQPTEYFCPANSHIDYVGAATRIEFLADPVALPGRMVKPGPPNFDSEYFEWIDLLESVLDARNEYTFVELGAGFGRWAATALCAAQLKRIPKFRAVLVEAEPVHCEWIRTNMTDNKIGADQYQLLEAAVAPEEGSMLFCVSWAGLEDPRHWYGQMLFTNAECAVGVPAGRTYNGRPILEFGPRGVIEVPTLPLAKIIGDCEIADLIDMDIQNAEGTVIQTSIDILNSKVKRVHIATHSHEIEHTIRTVMTEAGWTKRWDFPCESISETPYGNIAFQDGVQGWTNPRFA